MESTQLVGEDYRVTIPSSIRKILSIEKGDYITIDIIEIAKKGNHNNL